MQPDLSREEQLALVYKYALNQELLNDPDVVEYHRHLLHRLDELYHWTDYLEDKAFPSRSIFPKIINCNAYVHRRGNRWSYFPNKWNRLHPERIRHYVKEKTERILKSFIKPDPFFAVGYSRNGFDHSWSFQFEVDLDLPEEKILDDQEAESLVNWEMVKFLQDQGLQPHILLSGNRSIYVAFFTISPIAKKNWIDLYESVRSLIVFNGLNDVNTFHGSGLRLPLSYHQTTGKQCRFLHDTSFSDTVRRIETIQPNSLSERDILEVAKECSKRFSPEAFLHDISPRYPSINLRERHLLEKIFKERTGIDPRKEKVSHAELCHYYTELPDLKDHQDSSDIILQVSQRLEKETDGAITLTLEDYRGMDDKEVKSTKGSECNGRLKSAAGGRSVEKCGTPDCFPGEWWYFVPFDQGRETGCIETWSNGNAFGIGY